MANSNFDQPINEADGAHEEGEESFDLAKLRLFATFFLRAPGRRPKTAITFALLALLVTVALVAFLPPVYACEIRVLAHRVVLPHDVGPQAPDPTAGAGDDVMKHDNLVTLIKQLDLVARWDASRPRGARLKDSVMTSIFGAPSAEDKTRALVGLLEKKLVISPDHASITFGVEWPNAQVAYDIVTAAYKMFLDARYESEVSGYSRRAQLLDMRAELSARDLDAAMADLGRVVQERKQAAANSVGAETPSATGQGGSAPVVRSRPAAPTGEPQAPDETTANLQEVRAQIRALEEENRRRIADVDSQLSDAQASLGPLHPTVIALKRKADALREPSAQLEALRTKERALVAKIAESTPPPKPAQEGGEPRPQSAPAAPTAPKALGVAAELREILRPEDDAPTAYAKSKLQSVSQQYSDLLNQTHAAQVELQLARDSFQETYSVARPAEVPRSPRKPNIPLVILGGLVAAVLLLFLAPGARDLLSGTFVEPWQIETALKLPLLGALPVLDAFPSASDAFVPPGGPHD